MKVTIDCPFCVGRLGYVVSTCEECCGFGEVTEDEDVSAAVKNGSLTYLSNNHTWPVYERDGFMVDIIGVFHTDEERLREAFSEIEQRFGVRVNIKAVKEQFLSPEDRAEKNALDKIAIDEYYRSRGELNAVTTA